MSPGNKLANVLVSLQALLSLVVNVSTSNNAAKRARRQFQVLFYVFGYVRPTPTIATLPVSFAADA